MRAVLPPNRVFYSWYFGLATIIPDRDSYYHIIIH